MSKPKHDEAVSFDYEQAARERGFMAVCGVDEAGRGPLAGPVVAAAVILPENCTLQGLNDSKKLSEKKREALYDAICQAASSYAIAMVDHIVIDQINILQATYQAMQQAIAGLSIAADYALIDGNRAPKLDIACECVVGGDAKSASIAAASILAKVTRDRYMMEMDTQYPAYAFGKHKGYGTKAHYEAILKYGSCLIHRKTFLKKFYAAHPEIDL